MRKGTLAAMALLLAVGAPLSAASPILSGEAEAHIFVEVVSNIAVGVVTPSVDLGQIATGEFEAEVTFRIDANVESVKITIIATDLYKGDSPTSSWKIPVLVSAGAVVDPADGNAMGGHGNTLAFIKDTTLHDLDAHETEQVEFESGQRDRFSQDVKVKVTYDQNYDEQPRGEYSGFIKLIAEIDP